MAKVLIFNNFLKDGEKSVLEPLENSIQVRPVTEFLASSNQL
jgi:hypothetical protein